MNKYFYYGTTLFLTTFLFISAYIYNGNSDGTTGSLVTLKTVNDTVPAVLWETLEWEVFNQSYSGNPYDIKAGVTFLHLSSGKILRTEMFYDENNHWKFRFTPIKTGLWEYSTSSDDPELNGITGAVIVDKNPDTTATGFLTHIGSKYAVQVDENLYKGFLFNVYMNKTKPEYSFREGSENDFRQYARETKNNGCNVIYSQVVANSWFKFPVLKYTEHNSKNPDPKTFRTLEKMLEVAREENVRLHIWAWGDESRQQTPIGVGEGINGKEDRRLMRYIAARLGPLPGWTMGYGFDLHEWVAKDGPEKVRTWAAYLDSHLGWKHLLSARGQELLLPNTINSYDGFGRKQVTLFTTPYGPKNYAEVFEDVSSDSTHPHLYEERHTYNRQDDPSAGTNGNWNLDMDKTRRLIWWEAMSGGMGGWFGFYETWSPAYGGYPYPNPEQLRTHRKFWIENSRFLIDYITDTNFTSGYGLRTKDFKNIIIYQEETDSITVNLTHMNQSENAVAVDTKKEYEELNLGKIEPGNFVWHAPYKSDWAIAIGNFENPYFQYEEPISGETKITLKSLKAKVKNNLVTLEWITSEELNVSGFEILKRSVSDSLWGSTGIIASYGNSLTEKSYVFIDEISNKDSLLVYGLNAIFKNGNREMLDSLEVLTNGNNSPDNLPEQIVLFQNYPNPFNNETIIEFGLNRKSKVRLTVFNNLGEKIIVLTDKILSEGFHTYKFSGKNLSSGIYYYLLEAEYVVKAGKMLLLK